MPEELLERLQIVADGREQTVNQLIIYGITEWLQSLAYAKKLRFIVVTKNFVEKLLELVDEEKLEGIIEEMADLTAEIFRDLLNIPLSRATFQDFQNILPTFICDQGLKWFEDIKIETKKDQKVLKGFHYMGTGFSKFFTNLSEKLLRKYFGYRLITETVDHTPNSVFLEFSPI